MHLCKIILKMSLAAMEKSLHVITEDKQDNSPFHLITMLHLLYLRLYISLLHMLHFWICLRQSACHLPKDL